MRVDADSCGNIRPVDGEDRQDSLIFFEIRWIFFLPRRNQKGKHKLFMQDVCGKLNAIRGLASQLRCKEKTQQFVAIL